MDKPRPTTLILAPSPTYIPRPLSGTRPAPLGVREDIRPAGQDLVRGSCSHFGIVKPIPIPGSVTDKGDVVASVWCA